MVTVKNSPDEFHSALKPSIWDLISDRDRQTVRGVVSVTNQSGFTKITTSFAHGYYTNDVILPALTVSGYNVAQTITTVINPTSFVTDLPFISAATGTVTRQVANFKLQANVRVFNGDLYSFILTDNGSGKILLTLPQTHFYTGDEILLVDNSEFHDGIYTILSLPTKSTIVLDANYGVDDVGSIRKGEIIGSKLSQAVEADIQPFTVDSASNSGGNVTYTLNVAHTFSVGDLVTGVGMSVGSYNGSQTVIAVPSSVQITTTTAFVSTATGVINSDPFFVYRFNLSGILLSQLYGNRFDLGSTNINLPSLGNVIPYVIFWQELFDDVNGLTHTESGDSLLDLTDVKKAMNTAIQHTEAQNLTIYTQENASKKFLSDSPSVQYMGLTEEIQLYVQTDLLTVNIRAEQFDNNGSSIGEISITPAKNMLGNVLMIPVNTNLISASISRVDVWLRNAINGDQVSEKKTIKRLDNTCTGVRFHFLNRRGGFDQYTFTGQKVVTQFGEKNTYDKIKGLDFNVSDKGMTVVSSTADTKVDVFSEYLNNSRLMWLSQLLTSSEVYVVENGVHIPVVMTNDSDVVRDTIDLVKIKASFIYANSINQT